MDEPLPTFGPISEVISRDQRRFLAEAAKAGARSSGCTCRAPFPKVREVTPEWVDLRHSRQCIVTNEPDADVDA